MKTITRRCVVLTLLLSTAACNNIILMNRHADQRAEFPPPKTLPKSSPPMPGVTADKKLLKGHWLFRHIQPHAKLEVGEQQLVYLIQFEPHDDGTYDLLYQAYWGGTRNKSDPRFAGVEVRESGRYSLSSQILLLEAQTTSFTQVNGSARSEQTIPNENRAYVAKVDKGFLNLAGRCAKYQIEPICREPFDLWYSYRWSA